VERVTLTATQSLEAKGVTFTKSMLQNSEEITFLINDASAKATSSITRSLQDLEQTAKGAVDRSQEDRQHGRVGDDGNPRHAAHRHHRPVRAAARGQYPAAGGV